MQSAGATYTEKITYPKQAQFTIAHRQQSGYKWEKTGKVLDYPGRKNILIDDRCELTREVVKYYNEISGAENLVIGEDGVVRTRDEIVIGTLGEVAERRYIKGKNTTWKLEQEARKFKPTNNDNIWMVNGDLYVDYKSSPQDKGLYLHLMMHNQNADFPFRDDSIAEVAFKVENYQKIASKTIEFEDDREEARESVSQLRNRKTKRFDEDKISFYTSVFPLQLGGLGSSEEKYVALLKMADENPKLIIDGINDGAVNYLSVVNMAMELQILVRERGVIKNTLTGNKVIGFKASIKQTEVNQMLLDYYSSKDGQNEFEFLKNQVEAKKVEMIGQ